MTRQGKSIHTGSEVFKAVDVQIIIFWVVPPCGLVSEDRHFRVVFWLHPQGQSKPVTSMGRQHYERFISWKHAISRERGLLNSFNPEDRSSMFLRNVGVHLHGVTTYKATI
jgi:hypothetical protein